jgi:septal ring factor EnvC (AmiA/AmiB activator)
MFPYIDPTSQLGQLDREMQEVKRELSQKANSYEIISIGSLNSRLDTLEHSCREIRSTVDSMEYRLQRLEESLKEEPCEK